MPDRKELDYPLGQLAAIVDLVPWKFASWQKVPETLQHELVQAGSQYFRESVALHKPSAIVATGQYARQVMRGLQPTHLNREGTDNRGIIEIDGRLIPWFGTVAPTGGKGRQFYDEMARIGPQLAELLHLEF